MKQLELGGDKGSSTPLKILIIITVGLFCASQLFLFTSSGVKLRYSAYIITSSSMEPSYPKHTLVILRRVEFDSLKEGDVIAFKSAALSGRLAFHRIVSTENGGYYTKGDNSQTGDNQLIDESVYVGKSFIKLTFVARYVNLIDSALGFILFFVVPIVVGTLIYVAIKFLKD